jgi:hypothetical protein
VLAKVSQGKLLGEVVLGDQLRVRSLARQSRLVSGLMEVPDPGRDTGGVLQPERHVVAERGLASEQLADVLSAHVKSAGQFSGVDTFILHPLFDEVAGGHDVVGACGVHGHACLSLM